MCQLSMENNTIGIIEVTSEKTTVMHKSKIIVIVLYCHDQWFHKSTMYGYYIGNYFVHLIGGLHIKMKHPIIMLVMWP